MSPAYGLTAAPGNDVIHGFMSPPGNGYMSPPSAPPAVDGYISQPGSSCISPRDFHLQHQHQRQHQFQHHFSVETRSPGCAEGGGGALSYRSQGPREPRQVQRDSPVAPLGQATSIEVGGYQWEECYRESDGKKFWRHKVSGAILTEDPYR